MTAPYVWHLWPSRYWPASLDEETQFARDLRHLVAHPPTGVRATKREPATRDPEEARRRFRVHITAVLNALRSGLSARELLHLVPGTAPVHLLEAYEHLQERRSESVSAWQAIVADVSALQVPQTLRVASQLLPVPLHRIATRSAVGGPGTPANVADIVAAISAQISAHCALVGDVELSLSKRVAPDPQAVELGARLHNPLTPALWGSAYYLPRRVTDLSPTRVADLLNERNLTT